MVFFAFYASKLIEIANKIGLVQFECLMSFFPYYTHNDFLQILMEIGIIGLFIYLTFFTLLIKNLLQKKGEKKFIPLIITLIIVIANSLINFPIHRTQEYIPFIICCAFIFSEKNFETERKKSNILPIDLKSGLIGIFINYVS